MTIRRRTAAAIAVTAAAATVLAGCGADGGSGGDARSSVTWMTILHTPTTPDTDGIIETALQEHTGFDIEFQWIPAASMDEKLNAALASDSLADIVAMPKPDSSTLRRALASGQFWDVEEYLDEFPNLAEIDPQTLEAAKIDGHLYGVPRQQVKARYGVLVRQDWLDALGLETPHTTEELAEVARAFAEDDPDGDGEDDTTGFYDRSESFDYNFRTLSGYFGAGSKFELNDDGEVIASFTTDAFKEAMEWYRGLYEDGAVNNEFVTVQKSNQRDAIAQDKGGLVVTGLFDASSLLALAQSADPDTTMDWALVNDVTHGDGPRRVLSDTNGGLGGWYAIPKSQVKTEDDLRTVLGFLDSLLDEESFALMTNGIEGTHYELDDEGVVTILDQPMWEQEVQPFASSRVSDRVVTYASTTPYVDEANELMTEQEEFAVINVAQSLTSETYDARWTELEQKARDAYNKYVVGQIEMSDYEAIMDDIAGDGLDQITEEFTASYEAANG
ncbi:extracellular solute-binding protein [Microbacterium karelineae]|uniref:extracellular solute-binding protein n=1 Tax=Microbacterium karelineae TaxID=2654283 RepID=UPI0012EA843B|nr:extracellular solute-binding protein [Microbacterium karelineae]